MSFSSGINCNFITSFYCANLPGGINPMHGRDAPELRQPYAGLTLNHALDVEIRDNLVKTESADDYSYVMDSGMTLGSGSGGNKNCKGRYLYDVRNYLTPSPLCHIQNSCNLVPLVCFGGPPYPHTLRTSYKYAPQGGLRRGDRVRQNRLGLRGGGDLCDVGRVHRRHGHLRRKSLQCGASAQIAGPGCL